MRKALFFSSAILLAAASTAASAATLRVDLLSGPNENRLATVKTLSASAKVGDPFVLADVKTSAYVAEANMIDGRLSLKPGQVTEGLQITATPAGPDRLLIDAKLSQILGIERSNASLSAPCDPAIAEEIAAPIFMADAAPAELPQSDFADEMMAEYDAAIAKRNDCFVPANVDMPSVSQWAINQNVSFKNSRVMSFDRVVSRQGAAPVVQRLRFTYAP